MFTRSQQSQSRGRKETTLLSHNVWKPLAFIVIEIFTKCAIPSNTSECFSHIIDLCQISVSQFSDIED